MSHSSWASWDHGLYLSVAASAEGSLIIASGPGILFGFNWLQAGLPLPGCGAETY